MFKLRCKPIHIFTVDTVNTVKLILFYKETWYKKDAERLQYTYFQKSLYYLSITIVSSTLECRNDDDDPDD